MPLDRLVIRGAVETKYAATQPEFFTGWIRGSPGMDEDIYRRGALSKGSPPGVIKEVQNSPGIPLRPVAIHFAVKPRPVDKRLGPAAPPARPTPPPHSFSPGNPRDPSLWPAARTSRPPFLCGYPPAF